MNNLTKRIISAIAYVAIMIYGVYHSIESFHILFISIGIICLFEMIKIRKSESTLTFYGFLPYIYIIMPFTLIHFIDPYLISIILILSWCFDTFAFFIGVKFGKHKILPSVSPKKSWEGFLGGLIFTILIFKFLILDMLSSIKMIDKSNKLIETIQYKLNNEPLHQIFTQEENVYIGILILSITATTGDFMASYYKRQAGVKDSSNLIPGHGGMIDRMDSFLITIPIIYILSLSI